MKTLALKIMKVCGCRLLSHGMKDICHLIRNDIWKQVEHTAVAVVLNIYNNCVY